MEPVRDSMVERLLMKTESITKNFNSRPHDLVIASYALGELKEKDRLQLVEKLWGLTQKFLILIVKSSFKFIITSKNLLQILFPFFEI